MAPHDGDDAMQQVIHSPCGDLRRKIHTVLVGPEQPGNVGSAARALANCGIGGSWTIVAPEEQRASLCGSQAVRLAVHAQDRLKEIRFVPRLDDAWAHLPRRRVLAVAATARVGSPSRPHPQDVGPAMGEVLDQLRHGIFDDLFVVFGCESDGLSNEDVALCDRIVRIPTDPGYSSLNLAQAVLIFSWELHQRLLVPEADRVLPGPSQRDRLVANLLELAEEAGFILPGDPHKMRPHLAELFQRLPPQIPEARTLHGLLAQVRRSLRAGHPVYKGRYRHEVEEAKNGERHE